MTCLTLTRVLSTSRPTSLGSANSPHTNRCPTQNQQLEWGQRSTHKQVSNTKPKDGMRTEIQTQTGVQHKTNSWNENRGAHTNGCPRQNQRMEWGQRSTHKQVSNTKPKDGMRTEVHTQTGVQQKTNSWNWNRGAHTNRCPTQNQQLEWEQKCTHKLASNTKPTAGMRTEVHTQTGVQHKTNSWNEGRGPHTNRCSTQNQQLEWEQKCTHKWVSNTKPTAGTYWGLRSGTVPRRSNHLWPDLRPCQVRAN